MRYDAPVGQNADTWRIFTVLTGDADKLKMG